MSSRPQFNPYSVITNGSMAGNLTSTPTIIQKLSMISYAFSWAGTAPVGTVSVQVSNDYELNPAGAVENAGTWNTLTVSYNGSSVTTIPVTGNSGSGLVDVVATGAYAIRAIYTAGSGTGVLQCVVAGKVS